MVSGFGGDSYEGKLDELGLTMLEKRRIRGDILQTWKILHGHDDIKEALWFKRLGANSVRETRASAAPLHFGPE